MAATCCVETNLSGLWKRVLQRTMKLLPFLHPARTLHPSPAQQKGCISLIVDSNPTPTRPHTSVSFFSPMYLNFNLPPPNLFTDTGKAIGGWDPAWDIFRPPAPRPLMPPKLHKNERDRTARADKVGAPDVTSLLCCTCSTLFFFVLVCSCGAISFEVVLPMEQ